MSYKTCPDCGSRMFEYGCVNCNEKDYISMQDGCAHPDYELNSGRIENKIVVKTVNSHENEDELFMSVINVIETCQFMKYKYADTIKRLKKEFSISRKI